MPVLDFQFQAAGSCGFDRHTRTRYMTLCCEAEASSQLAEICWNPSNSTLGSVLRRELCCDRFASLQLDDACSPVLERLAWPSASRPLVFLHLPRVGGSTLEGYLGPSARRFGVQSLISSLAYNVVGTPFFVKFYPEQLRRSAAVVSGHFDWDLIASDALQCQERASSCVILTRNPLDRFLSYYAKRSGVIGTDWTDMPASALEELLMQSARDTLGLRVEEGAGCSKSAGLCYDVEALHEEPERNFTRMLRLERAMKRPRVSLGAQYGAQWGPIDAMAWMLDPEGGEIEVARSRLGRCLPGLLVEETVVTKTLLRHYFPWLRFGHMHRERNDVSARLRRQLNRRPDLKNLIEVHNKKDLELYRYARRQFWSLVVKLPSDVRRIWSYWEGPMPSLHQLCIDTWTFEEVRILGPEDLAGLQLALPESWPFLQPAQRADYLKVILLQRYGGLWLDADTIVTHEPALDAVFRRLETVEMVVWTTDNTDGSRHIGVWAIAAKPGAAALDEWRRQNDASLGEALVQKADVPWPALGAWQLPFLNDWVKQGYAAEILDGGGSVHPVPWDQQHRLIGNETLRRASQPFVALNAATMPRELLEASRSKLLRSTWALSRLLRDALRKARNKIS